MLSFVLTSIKLSTYEHPRGTGEGRWESLQPTPYLLDLAQKV